MGGGAVEVEIRRYSIADVQISFTGSDFVVFAWTFPKSHNDSQLCM